ncbi:hypothetical protein ASF17_10540 [Frigoribacterium sp. Leaf263]|uniref:hypothetical protein n=1 Tax=Frigoribacterium sp. Leaf263 TaxID=1736313 RepID=UPI0006FB3EAC|nr:hypothetical protein [Frigoribacterium sp. Leaf263]KQO81590.1 hypothetical protein ASF17_10540 [Frigoribacterium sp. Leaf263]
MSTFTNPTGPQPPSVYWRRRAVVALGLIAVIVIIVLIVVRPGSSSGEPGTAPTSSAPPADEAPADTATEPAAAETAPAADATAEPTAGASTADGTACDPGDIALAAILDKESYAPTELPQMAMSITNTGDSDCVIDLGSNQQRLVVSSGEEQYWSSKDCQVNGTDQDVTLTAGQTLETPAIAWDRTRSSPDTCDSESRDAVPAAGATYRLSVFVGDITSADAAPMILN